MKSTYGSVPEGSTAYLVEVSPRFWVLTGIAVRPDRRGRGYASRLLKRVLDEADSEAIVICLAVEPDEFSLTEGLAPLPYEALEAWYGRNGFSRWTGHPDNHMIRWPAGRTGRVEVHNEGSYIEFEVVED